jgi:hypothetical protein
MEYVQPTILTTMQASSVIAVGVNGCNPLIKAFVLQDACDQVFHRSTSGAYQADE